MRLKIAAAKPPIHTSKLLTIVEISAHCIYSKNMTVNIEYQCLLFGVKVTFSVTLFRVSLLRVADSLFCQVFVALVP